METNVKMGNVLKCPSCGAPYQPGTGACPECGHVFQNVAANSSAQRLADGIQAIHEKYSAARLSGQYKEEKKGFFDTSEDPESKEISDYISNFVIPSSKDDLIEFITRTHTLKDNSDYWDSYEAKFNEAITKARVMFPNDPQMTSVIQTLAPETLKEHEQKSGCMSVIVIGIILGGALFFI